MKGKSQGICGRIINVDRIDAQIKTVESREVKCIPGEGYTPQALRENHGKQKTMENIEICIAT